MQPPRSSGPDITAAVLNAADREPAIRLPRTFLLALALHAIILVGVRHKTIGPHVLEPPTGPTTKEYEFDLAPFQPPRPPAVVPERTIREHRAAFTKAPPTAVHTERAVGHETAQAATILAQAPKNGAPVDLTADTVVTGTATAYAGGVTASNGTSASLVEQGPRAPSPPRETSSAALDLSIPVSLASENWSCPWPHEADTEQIDEQTVILRVVVAAGGDPESATVVFDPGHGFGAAAAVCALRTHFTPGRNHTGEPVRALSPPIRVRFTR